MSGEWRPEDGGAHQRVPPPPPGTAGPPPPGAGAPPPGSPPPRWAPPQDGSWQGGNAGWGPRDAPPWDRPPGTWPPGPPAGAGTNGAAVAALVCGVVALALSWMPLVNILSLFAGIAAVILGIVGLRRARGHATGRGLAIGGIVTGVLAFLVAALMYVALAALFNVGDGNFDFDFDFGPRPDFGAPEV